MMMTMMGWSSSSSTSSKDGWRKGPWTPDEDKLLTEYVRLHGEGRWSSVSKSSGLNRSGKSCRLRWVNYLRPGLKRGQITPQEEGIIIELHALWGNKWSTIARYLPGRTDNEIKNYWRTHFKKKEKNPSLKQQKRKAWLKQQQQEQLQQPPPQLFAATDAVPSVINSIESAENCCPVITPDSMSSWSDFLGDDALLLEGLFNLDDTNNTHHVDHFVNCNKMAIQNPAALGGFSYNGEGDGFGNNGGFYIF